MLSNRLTAYKKIALIGMGKNVGKTTVLNHLIAGFAAQDIPLALTSIGRDGEDTDVVTKTAKPRIFVPAGSIIATAESLLPLCETTREILDVTDYHTPMGRIVIMRALSAGRVQIAGPSIVAQMAQMLEILPPVGKVIIDGAISRKSLAAPHVADCAVLCTGAAISPDINAVIAQTRHAAEMYSLPVAAPSEHNIALQGIVTDSKIQALLNVPDLKNKRIIAEDAGKIFISAAVYEKLKIRQGRLAVKNSIKLAAIAINPTSPQGVNFPPGEFLKKMSASITIPVYDVMGGGR